jgi:hypothetical protein
MKNKQIYREYYQVITTDREHYFSEHPTIYSCIDQINWLLSSTPPHSTYEYAIIHVIETKTEELINYPVTL